jgi:hypothetical protein
MIMNPYVSSGVAKHDLVEEDDQGCAKSACGRVITLFVKFEGFVPPLCAKCFPAKYV